MKSMILAASTVLSLAACSGPVADAGNPHNESTTAFGTAPPWMQQAGLALSGAG
jgi:hypothetical protein